MVSILEESQRARKRGFLGFFKQKKIIITLAILIVAGALYYFLPKGNSAEVAVQPKEWTAKKDNLKISIQADGKVVAEDGVELSFSVSGDTLEVEDVFVKEGDKIKKGDKIATVKTDDLQYDLNKAYASYQSTLASYNESMAGATEKQKQDSLSSIEQAKISLEQTKSSLQKTKVSAAQSIDNAEETLKDAEEAYNKNKDINNSKDIDDVYEILVDTIKATSISLESILPDSDEILGIDNIFINDDYEHLLGVKNINTLSVAKNSYNIVKAKKQALDILATPLSRNSSYLDINKAAEQAEKTLEEFEKHLYDMQLLIDATITDDNLNQSSLNSFKSTVNSNRSAINTKITTLSDDIKDVQDVKDSISDYKDAYDDARQALEDAKSDAEQDISNAESSVRNKELSLESAQANYDDLIAPLTESELASLRSSLTSAVISLDKAKNDFDKATLTSPIDGEVVLLNYKTGDIILTSDSKPVVSIINNETLFIEVNIEEADINKVKVGQKAYATFDALDGLELEGEVTFISLTSETSNQGIVTYLVRVVFENKDSQIREGMTAFVDFITAEAKDVLVVPVDAVRNVDGKPSVESVDVNWIPVTTGFTDGKYVEVISGLNEGDKILY